jgi:hypothetical protein
MIIFIAAAPRKSCQAHGKKSAKLFMTAHIFFADFLRSLVICLPGRLNYAVNFVIKDPFRQIMVKNPFEYMCEPHCRS